MTSAVPLIDRAIFFDDPEIAGARISPVGDRIAFLQPRDGVMNIWVKGTHEPFGCARALTAETVCPIRHFWWSHDGRWILYIQDSFGDENYHLYRITPDGDAGGTESEESLDLTPYQQVQVRIVSQPRPRPGHVLIGMNDRDQRFHDVYWLDLATGENECVIRNDAGVANWIADLEGNPRLASRQAADGGWELLPVVDGSIAARPVFSCTADEVCAPMRFHPDGHRVYMQTNAGERNLTELVLMDAESGDLQRIHGDPEGEADFGGAHFSPATDELQAVWYVGDRLRVYSLDEDFGRHYRHVRSVLPTDGDVYITSLTRCETYWLIAITSDRDPGTTYLYHRENGQLTLLYRPRPRLPTRHMAPMTPIRYHARDGLEIPAYLTVPPGQDQPQGLPVVVHPHGGPWTRDVWGYNATTQFLANRGYAVFQPNFRGSSGFGKAFLNAGNRQWGTGAMQHDLTDGVEHLVATGVADPERIAILGASYGGYAALSGVTYTPDRYCAAVSIVGPSNILTLLGSLPPYWSPVKQVFDERVGDPSVAQERERLVSQSPLYSAQRVTAPLLIVQGANDPRVARSESDQIVAALHGLGRDVEYLVAADEGHGFVSGINRMAMYAAIERFLARFVGGRRQMEIPDKVARRLEALRVSPDECAQAGTSTGSTAPDRAAMPDG